MPDWTSNYAVGNRVDVKIENDWFPGTIRHITLGLDIRGELDLKAGDIHIPFIARGPDQIRPLRAAAPAPAAAKPGKAAPAAAAGKPKKPKSG